MASASARDHVWSASRLEAYRSLPLLLLRGQRAGPGAPARSRPKGWTPASWATSTTSILEDVLPGRSARSRPGDLDQLLAALPGVAAASPGRGAAAVRDSARPPGGTQTRERSSRTSAARWRRWQRCRAALSPTQHEAAFGLCGQPELVVREGDDSFRLRGFIDRVDRAADGRVRVIDYKTAGPGPFSRKAVAEGKKLQLPLYALAARDALGLGEPVEGFYWHVRHAEPSRFTLGGSRAGRRRDGRGGRQGLGGGATAREVAILCPTRPPMAVRPTVRRPPSAGTTGPGSGASA